MPYGKREWGQEKILIVDDVETNRLVLEEIIHSMGCSPVLAESGEEALAMVSVSHPQLVLTDISHAGHGRVCVVPCPERKRRNQGDSRYIYFGL